MLPLKFPLSLNNMTIEYLPNLQSGDRIDLNRFQKNKPEPKVVWEKYVNPLHAQLENLSRQVNQEIPNFLEVDGRIALVGPESKQDQQLVDQQEKVFSQNQGKSLEQWQRDGERNPANLTEMALTVSLHKFLGNDFIVARASRFDDYNNGVDQVIVDKQTGDVICGFDEVLGHQGDDGGEKKKKKMERIREKGGVQIKYGASLENGRLVPSSIKNVPAFYLSLSKEELKDLLEALVDQGEAISAVEINIFNKLLDSLKEQTNQADANWSLRAKSQLAIDKLQNSFRKQLAA